MYIARIYSGHIEVRIFGIFYENVMPICGGRSNKKFNKQKGKKRVAKIRLRCGP